MGFGSPALRSPHHTSPLKSGSAPFQVLPWVCRSQRTPVKKKQTVAVLYEPGTITSMMLQYVVYGMMAVFRNP